MTRDRGAWSGRILPAVLLGIMFGIYPAVRAASLYPIEALRHE